MLSGLGRKKEQRVGGEPREWGLRKEVRKVPWEEGEMDCVKLLMDETEENQTLSLALTTWRLAAWRRGIQEQQ